MFHNTPLGAPRDGPAGGLLSASNNVPAGNNTGTTGGDIFGELVQPKENQGTSNGTGTGGGLFGRPAQPKPTSPFGGSNNTQASNSKGTTGGPFGSGFSTTTPALNTQPTAKPQASAFGGGGFGSSNNNGKPQASAFGGGGFGSSNNNGKPQAGAFGGGGFGSSNNNGSGA
jgi:hypothetical protein